MNTSLLPRWARTNKLVTHACEIDFDFMVQVVAVGALSTPDKKRTAQKLRRQAYRMTRTIRLHDVITQSIAEEEAAAREEAENREDFTQPVSNVS